MMRRLHHLFASTALTLLLHGQSARSGETTCVSDQTDWYTDVVGETPCRTYERLRQICNTDYQVPKFQELTPGDICADQLSTCCCNSVAWALSMLCFNCQYNKGPGNGIDAGQTGYQIYLGTCGKGLAHALPDDIQSAVCNREVKIDRNLYNLFWDDGAWFYQFTKQTMQKDFAATNNNTFTKCQSTIRTTTSNTPTDSKTSTEPKPSETQNSTEEPKKKSNVAAIAGGVVGGVVVGCAVAFLAACLVLRRRRRGAPTREDVGGAKEIDLGREYDIQDVTPDMSTVTPFSDTEYGHTPDVSGNPRGGEYSALPTAPSAWGKRSFRTPGSEGSDGELRHTDAGVVPDLHRSPSGRLPPAYESWMQVALPPPGSSSYTESGPPSEAYTGVAPSEAYTGVAPPSVASPSSSSGPSQQPSAYGADVKRPIP